MEIDFGRVNKYFTEKGFGFVSHSFLNPRHEDVFFHIKIIKRAHPDLAKRLDNEDFSEAESFWYEIEDTHKGKQVKSVLDLSDISDEEVEILCKKIECIWKDEDLNISNCLFQASKELLGADRTSELSNEKEVLEIKEKEKHLKILKKEDASRRRGVKPKLLMCDGVLRMEIDRTEQALIELKDTDSKLLELVENEFRQLIAEMASLGFTHSKELSSYINKNRLGDKYKNIAGVVEMEKDGDTWDYKGGFPPKMYKKICQELDLDNEGSSAKAVGFRSFNELYD